MEIFWDQAVTGRMHLKYEEMLAIVVHKNMKLGKGTPK